MLIDNIKWQTLKCNNKGKIEKKNITLKNIK